MWKHHRDEKSGWKYSITSDSFIVLITGGSITIKDARTGGILKRHTGHHYLYTGDIRPDEKECFALENGKHFYVYSLESLELVKRVTLPRGYECIDMYGHYSEDGKFLGIPASKWIGNEYLGEGHYEYVMCRYETEHYTLVDKTILDDPKAHWWQIDESLPEPAEEDWEELREKMDLITENLDNKNFLDQLLGMQPEGNDPDVDAIMKIIFGE